MNDRPHLNLVLRSILVLMVLCLCPGCKTPETAREKHPGEIAFKEHCISCHRLPSPDDKTAEEWPAFLEEHAERARLNDEKKRLILEYLQRK